MFIDGKAVDADSFYEIRSPATEELVCTVAKGTVEPTRRSRPPGGRSRPESGLGCRARSARAS